MGDPKEFVTPSAIALSRLRNTILETWISRVSHEVRGAEGLRKVILVNTAPAFLDNLAEALDENFPRETASDSSTIAQEHGGERARLSTYGPEQLIKEYQILRETVIEKLTTEITLTERDRQVIHRSIDQSLTEAMTAFVLVHAQVREQFVASLSHDLRNPLGAARLSAQLILNLTQDLPPGDLREDLIRLATRIVSNTKRADRMIQDLLDATALRMGERVSLSIAESDLLSAIRDVIVDLPPDDYHRVHVIGASVRGWWDGDALRRAIENLVTNAVKYGEKGKPITIRVSAVGSRIIIAVHNEGNPISLEEQKTLFLPFRRGPGARVSAHPGWGIGLALVRSVAEAHGGSIAIDSLPGKGTTFILDIPQDARPFRNAPVSGGG